ncbi:MAG TPA: 50S ribosomal protein P1 [Ignisphaera sp.]|nr:50S ribosomal protein P1 [Ignisphaera sp.]
MEYVYAVLLLHAAKKDINEENLKRVLEAAGIAVDDVRIKALVAAVKEINIEEVIKSATAVPVAPAVAPAAPQQPVSQPEKPSEEKKEEEEKKEVSEEQLAEGLAALFG